jgi:hypothetical protein
MPDPEHIVAIAEVFSVMLSSSNCFMASGIVGQTLARYSCNFVSSYLVFCRPKVGCMGNG